MNLMQAIVDNLVDEVYRNLEFVDRAGIEELAKAEHDGELELVIVTAAQNLIEMWNEMEEEEEED